jgi:hypothetical protein
LLREELSKLKAKTFANFSNVQRWLLRWWLCDDFIVVILEVIFVKNLLTILL